MRGDYVVVVPKHLIEWGERMGVTVDSVLVWKAVRQYLKTLERTRAYKKQKRKTQEGRDHINRLNRESAARRRSDWRGE